MSDRRRVGVAVAAGLYGAVVGLVLGLVAAHLLRPTNAEIRAAGRSLVPPGVAIASVESGYQGHVPTRGPYGSYIDTFEPEQDHRRRLDSYLAHADATGWRLVGREDEDGGVVLHYTRAGIAADVYVFNSKASTSINTGREEAADAQSRRVGVTLGVAAAPVIALGIWLVLERRSKSVTESETLGSR